MARTRTREQLRDEIRSRADLLSVRHSDADINRQIDQSIAELYDLLISVNKDYFLSSDDTSVVSGTDSYALPSDFYRVIGVDVYDNGKWYNMRRFVFAERNKFQDSDNSKRSAGYRVMGSNLRIYPSPGWSGTVRLWYIPVPSLLSTDASTFDGVAGWEEYVVVDACIKFKLRDEEDARAFMAQKEALIERIRDVAAERDDGEPDHVRDVYTELHGDSYPRYDNP